MMPTRDVRHLKDSLSEVYSVAYFSIAESPRLPLDPDWQNFISIIAHTLKRLWIHWVTFWNLSILRSCFWISILIFFYFLFLRTFLMIIVSTSLLAIQVLLYNCVCIYMYIIHIHSYIHMQTNIWWVHLLLLKAYVHGQQIGIEFTMRELTPEWN